MSRQSEARKTRRAEKRTGKMKVEIIQAPHSFAQAMDSTLNAIEALDGVGVTRIQEKPVIDWRSSIYAPMKLTPEEMEVRDAENLVSRLIYEELGVTTWETLQPGYQKFGNKVKEAVLSVVSRDWEAWSKEKDLLVENGIAEEYLEAFCPRPSVGLEDYQSALYNLDLFDDSPTFHDRWRVIRLREARLINEIVPR